MLLKHDIKIYFCSIVFIANILHIYLFSLLLNHKLCSQSPNYYANSGQIAACEPHVAC